MKTLVGQEKIYGFRSYTPDDIQVSIGTGTFRWHVSREEFVDKQYSALIADKNSFKVYHLNKFRDVSRCCTEGNKI